MTNPFPDKRTATKLKFFANIAKKDLTKTEKYGILVTFNWRRTMKSVSWNTFQLHARTLEAHYNVPRNAKSPDHRIPRKLEYAISPNHRYLTLLAFAIPPDHRNSSAFNHAISPGYKLPALPAYAIPPTHRRPVAFNAALSPTDRLPTAFHPAILPTNGKHKTMTPFPGTFHWKGKAYKTNSIKKHRLPVKDEAAGK